MNDFDAFTTNHQIKYQTTILSYCFPSEYYLLLLCHACTAAPKSLQTDSGVGINARFAAQPKLRLDTLDRGVVHLHLG
jgi:hypothetical protein